MATQLGVQVDAVTGVVINSVEISLKGIHRAYKYAKNPGSYYRRMMRKADTLCKRKDDVAARALVNIRQGMRPTHECTDWSDQVDAVVKTVQEIEDKYLKDRELKWKLFRPRLRSNLSKHMVEISEELDRLYEIGENFATETGVERSPEPVRQIYGPRTEDKPSLERFVQDTIEFLGVQNVRRIGIWGMPGIGKTTIMQNLNDNEKIAQMFDIVIFVNASKALSIEELQHVIVQRLKLRMEGITRPDETALRISEELKGRNYLLLLDEVTDILDLRALGIHDNQVDGKVVLATRYRDICCDMNVDKQIKVKQLSYPDAMKMFREKVGPNINLPGIEQIAKLVVSECSGLPLLIEKVARSFRRKDNIQLWRNGLENLRKWPTREIQGMDEVLELLKFCYDHLEGDEKKVCFLYGALFPEERDMRIDYLLECWIAEGFIPDPTDLRDSREKGHTILDSLINVSLLERSEKMKHVKMNKVLRDMALRIASQREDCKILVRSHNKNVEPLDNKEWEEANRICFIDNELSLLPEQPCCNNLWTLLLQGNSDLTIIPNLFFRSMECLRILDLQRTGITSLPASLSRLTRLKALYLNSCEHLKVLPSIMGELKDLEVLDIQGSGINYLPRQIVNLTRLRCLRISSSNFGAQYLNNPNVISILSSLEELSIDVDGYEHWCDRVGEAITKEVSTLTKLTTLAFCFPKVECLNFFITENPSWKKNRLFFNFQFLVGCHAPLRYAILDHLEYEIEKCLKFVNGEGVHDAISKVLAETHAFELIGHKGVFKLSDFGFKSMNQMRGCLIEGCNEIETIIDGNTITTGILKCLEKMYIKNVSNLERIWQGPVSSGSLVELTTLVLHKCPKLKELFSESMIQQLYKLQCLSIEECPEIEEIVMESQNGGLDHGVLPKLKTLVLLDLPKLRNIWVDDSLDWPSLETVKIFTCNSLIRLPFNNSNATNLRSIECQQSWWNALQQEYAIKQRVSKQNVVCSNPHIVLLLHIKSPTEV